MSVECKTGGTCFLYPMCSCGYEDKARLMATRCEDCKTNDTCNVLGCIKPVDTIPYSNVMDVQIDPCVNGRGNCKHLGVCSKTCLDSIEPKATVEPECCNDPGDCSEPCNVVYPSDNSVVGNEDPDTYIQSLINQHKLGCQLDEGCNNEGKVDECPRCSPELDGRNEGPVNQFGCSYVDCDCTSPCWEKSKTINITINGTMNGDFNF